MRRSCSWVLCILLALNFCAAVLACANGEEQMEPDPIDPSDYTQTEQIAATLTVSDGKATCTGIVAPRGKYSCSLEMSLYKKDGNEWDKIQTWSTSATGGNSAVLIKTATVAHGTYKVVSNGYVDGESSSATSKAVSW